MAWTQEVEKAKAGDFEVNLYDDSGYSAMKRVLERGDDATSVKPLVTIVVNHPVSSGHNACRLSVVSFGFKSLIGTFNKLNSKTRIFFKHFPLEF